MSMWQKTQTLRRVFGISATWTLLVFALISLFKTFIFIQKKTQVLFLACHIDLH